MKEAVINGECGEKGEFFRMKKNATCLCAVGNDSLEKGEK